jgi:hypothetical protein
MLGPACTKKECQGKRWAEFKLSDGQGRVFQETWEGKKEKEIAYGMGLRPKSKRTKQLKTTIARKLWVPCDRVFLARCYGERLVYMKSCGQLDDKNAPTPPLGTLPAGAP